MAAIRANLMRPEARGARGSAAAAVPAGVHEGNGVGGPGEAGGPAGAGAAGANGGASGPEERRQHAENVRPPGPLAEATNAVSRAVGGGNQDGVGGV